MRRAVIALTLCGMLSCMELTTAESIWIEGEAASEHSFAKHGWYDGVKKNVMSAGDWLSHYHHGRGGEARYELTVQEGGQYAFWVRCNYFKVDMAYRLNNDDWRKLDFGDVRDQLMVSERPDHRFVGWVKVGKVRIERGNNTIYFRLAGDKGLGHHGGIDCMCVTNDPFVPSGAMKPGAPGGEKVDTRPVVSTKDWIWIEGEATTKHSFRKHGWYDKVAKDVFSLGDWLSHYDNRSGAEATYELLVKETGDYVFWVRCNPFRVDLSYRLDDGEWTKIGFGDLRGRLMVSPKPDHRYIAWVKVGKLALSQGDHLVAFRLAGEKGLGHHGGIDCMCFAKSRFVPAGTTRPGQAEGAELGPADWFPVVMDDDEFSEESVIDMSSLIPRPAGKFGFLKRDGADLRFENAEEPIKFWGCGANLDDRLSRAKQTQRIRYLVKHGVNMIRQHPAFGYLGPLRNGELDKEKLDKWDWWCAELKKHGIYMTWSVFYPLVISEADGYDPALFAELQPAGRDKSRRSTSGLVNISRKLQDLQIAYAKKLLEHVNPYTGLAYKDDPALAVLEIHNEDCIFWHWPLNSLQGRKFPRHLQMLKRMFCEWAKRKYRSDRALQRAWGTRDSLASGELDIYGAWQFKGDKPNRRLGDFIHFLTDLQRRFYERREKEYREAGYKAVTVTTAWRAGGPAADPANLYCDTAMDMVDRHNYCGGGVGGHGIRKGKVNNETHLAQAGSRILSSGMYQVEDRPFCITEWTQLPPNQWKAEIAPLFAFYGMGLQGWDASYHFLNGRTRIGDGWPGLSSYVTDTPHYIGQFPALAFAIYKGHIREAPIVAARRLKVDDLFLGIDPLRQDFSGGGYDEKTPVGNLATPTEVLAIGRVTVSFDGKRSGKQDWSRYWDQERKIVRSVTGDLAWDMAARVVTVTSPKTQAVIGFAGGTMHDLPGVRAEIKTPFVSLIFTPLDDEELMKSRHILITALGQDKQTGTRYSADGTMLEVVGGPPLLMEPVQATITLKGDAPREVNVLDFYGVPTRKQVKTVGGSFAIDGMYRTYYYEVKR